MKDKIEGIFEIDEKTKKIVDLTDKEIAEDVEDLRKTLTAMENESNEKAKKTAMEEFDKVISEAEKEAEEKNSENAIQLKEIDKIYEEHKEELIEEAFSKIVLGRDD